MDSETKAKFVLSEEMLRIIRGDQCEAEKHHTYDSSLQSWWKEYAARKNDEEEEHVADSLLYDERCHLPRTIPPPECVQKASQGSEIESKAPQQTGNGSHS